MKKLVKPIIYLLIIGVVIGLVLHFTSKPAKADWYDEGWAYRASLTFINSGSAVTNQYVTFALATNSTYANLQSNCNDARFTDTNGNLLQYYQTNTCQAASTTYHVLMPNIPVGGNLVWFYFGNPNAVAGGNSADFTQSSFSQGTVTQGSIATGPGPVAYWQFNEGIGTTTTDSTQNKIVATLAGATKPTWQSADQCIEGNCLFFNGSTSNNTVATVVSNVKTVSLWVRPNSVSSSALIDLDGGTHKITVSSGTISASGFTSPTIYVNGQTSSTLSANSWQLVTVTTGTAFNTSSSLTMGKSSSTFLKGFLDEVKLYNYARSSTQVLADYQARGTSKGNSAVLGASDQNLSSLSNGLAGYWKLDDGSGTSAVDSSGNGVSGTLVNTPTWAAGKFGGGVTMNGSNQDITADSTIVGNLSAFTVSVWYKSNSSSKQKIFSERNSASANAVVFVSINENVTNDVAFAMQDDTGGASYIETDSPGAISSADGNWHMVTIVANSTSSRSLYFDGNFIASTTSTIGTLTLNRNTLGVNRGSSSSNFLNGTADEWRMYNRALSGTEIAQLYNWAPGPTGWWHFDEKSYSVDEVDSSGAGIDCGPADSNQFRFVPGKISWALRDGPTSGGSVSCAANSAVNNLPAMSAAFWIYPDTVDGGGDILNKGDNSFGNVTQGWVISYGINVDDIDFTVGYNTTNLKRETSNNVLTEFAWNHVVVTWDGSTSASNVHIYVNGKEVSYQTTTNGSSTRASDSSDTLAFFNEPGQTEKLTAYLDEVKLYNYPRTTKQTIADMNGGHPAGGSPVGSQQVFYNFDEGYGTTANNTISTSYNGTITGATWKTPSSCKINGCLSFASNATDNVSAGNATFLDSVTGFATSFWINPQTLGTGRAIISKSDFSTKTLFAVTTDASVQSELRVYIANATNDVSNYFTTNNVGLATGNWYQITVVYDGTQNTTNRVKVYKNGVRMNGAITGTIPTTTAANSSSNLKIGSSDDTTNHKALGAYIDEVKIYNAPLSDTDVAVDSNNGSALTMGGVLGTQNNEGFSTSAPILNWNFNEDSGTTANDSSGNGNTGTITAGNQWTFGKVSSGLRFDGSSQSVTATITSLGNTNTLEAWIYPTTSAASKTIITASKLTTDGSSRPNYGNCVGTALALNTWTQIIAVSNGSGSCTIYQNGIQTASNTTGVTFGTSVNVAASSFSGTIDEVKIYNVALTTAQAAYEYNRGAPTAWYEFDECQGNIAHDSSVNANNGTITIGGSGTYTSVGTCQGTSSQAWKAGAVGKFNSAIAFDGTDDNVHATSITGVNNFDHGDDFSVSVWVNLPSDQIDHGTTENSIIENDNSGTPYPYRIRVENSTAATNGDYYLDRHDNAGHDVICNGPELINDNTWHNIIFTKIGSAITGYLDGRQNCSAIDNATGSTLGTGTLNIGDNGASNRRLNGLVDDVRIYNYGLTANQVKTVYTDGGAQRFAPATGTP